MKVAVGHHYSVSTDGRSQFTLIQDALDAAPPGTLIEILPGRYTEQIQIRGKWVHLTSQDPADPGVVAATILDGGGAAPVIAFDGTEGAGTRISGLTVTGAAGYGLAAIDRVGGLSVDGSLARVEQCRVVQNECTAIRKLRGPVRDCVISGNWSPNGGTVELCSGGLLRCVISGNRASGGGALVNCYGLKEQCFFVNNSSLNYGGALSDCYSDITDCVFLGNRARNTPPSSLPSGGAISGGAGRLENCVLADNYASQYGGAISSWRGSVERCVITGNKARTGAGLYSCRAEIVNSLLTDNASEYGGSGVSNCDSLQNCTFVGNRPVAILAAGNSPSSPFTTAVSNTIVWDNGSLPLAVDAYGILNVEHCTIEHGPEGVAVAPGGSLVWGEGNLDLDPQFGPVETWRLGSSSPCLDAGGVNGPGIDLDGVARPLGSGRDQGAYERDPDHSIIAVAPLALRFQAVEGLSEFPSPHILSITNGGAGTLAWSVATDTSWLTVEPATGMSDGETDSVIVAADSSTLSPGTHVGWVTISAPESANAPRRIPVELTISPSITVCPDGSGDYLGVQAAIDAAAPGDTIVVCPGTYQENIRFGGKAIAVRSLAPNDPSIVAATVLDGSQNGPVVTFAGWEFSDTVLSGFTITNGRATNGGGIQGREGSYDRRTEATVRHCVITGNETTSTGTGGGIWRCAGLIADCTIRDNTARDGGGMENCTGTMERCVITGNEATRLGGGLYNCNSVIRQCNVVGNSAGTGGGAFAVCGNRISDSIVTGNRAPAGGGVYQCSAMVINCDILGNTLDGVYRAGGGGTLRNCILRSNRPSQITLGTGTQLLVEYSNVEGGWLGDGNIDLDALFATPGDWDDGGTPDDPEDDEWIDGDYHLDAGSPCVDAGTPVLEVDRGAMDLEGNARIRYCRVDMGAYESAHYVDCDGNGTADACDLENASVDDCNANHVPDSCDVVAGGDFNADGSPDTEDLASLARAMGGPGATPDVPEPACLSLYLNAFDADMDDDIDLEDFATFQDVFPG